MAAAVELGAIFLELGFRPDNPSSVILDKVLMFKYKTTDIICAICPLAKQVIVDSWKRTWQQEMDKCLSTIMTSPQWGNDTKGRAVEYYILDRLSAGNLTLGYRSIQDLERNGKDPSKELQKRKSHFEI